jgi:hypothetical protein
MAAIKGKSLNIETFYLRACYPESVGPAVKMRGKGAWYIIYFELKRGMFCICYGSVMETFLSSHSLQVYMECLT